jgi:hypothetical protein
VAEFGLSLFDQHAALLRASAISPEVARARGYVSVDTATRLEQAGFGPTQRRVPGLLIPVRGVDGSIVSHEYRPDQPRITNSGRTLKYEKPAGSVNRLDVPPAVSARTLADPSMPLWLTEGARKVDAAVTAGLCCIGLSGVYGWRATDKETGGKVALPDFESIAWNGREVVLAFDSDVTTKPQVAEALRRLARFLEGRGARVRVCVLPDMADGKTGLDDFLAAGHRADDLAALVVDKIETGSDDIRVSSASLEPAESRSLAQVVATFREWLWLDDLVPLYATLGAYAANTLDGDPCWLILVGGSGRGKTEIAQALAGLPGVRLAAVLTEAALLSGTSKKERAANASGGLLREIGERGTLVLKDFTSILSMNRDTRAALLAALREIFDGRWSRHVGTDGGQTLSWQGKLAVIACSTTAIDRAHAVTATMGERFLLCRLPAVDTDDIAAHALAQAGRESEMRAALIDAVRGLFATGLPYAPRARIQDELKRLVRVARLVALSRSPIERDHQGELDLVLDPEAPTRLAKQLERLWAGLDTIGHPDGWQVVVRVGLDSIPKLRRAVMAQLTEGEWRTTTEIATAVRHPTRTTRRALEELTAHHVCERDAGGEGHADRWRLAEWAAQTLDALTVPEMSERAEGPDRTDESDLRTAFTNPITKLTDISGTVPMVTPKPSH